LSLVRCQACRSAIGRLAANSIAEFKCRHCGALTLART